jgi:hypothetical protein
MEDLPMSNKWTIMGINEFSMHGLHSLDV